jgi:hypothetical protein
MHYHDGKTEHTSPQNYRDIDGNMRTFTVIDCDKRTNISTKYISPEEFQEAKDYLKKKKEEYIKMILSLPAVSILRSNRPEFLENLGLINRDPERGIVWEENAVKEYCDINELIPYVTGLWKDVWFGTVKPEFLHENLSFEDIVKGKWKIMVQH